MQKKLLYLFIFFAPFTSFFAISAWLRIPVVINQLLFLFIFINILFHRKIITKWLYNEDLILLVFLLLVWLSFLLGFKEKRSFNHSLAYTNSILFYFFLTKYAIALLKISVTNISKMAYLSFIAISIIIIADFIGKNYFNLNIRNIFSTADGVTSNMDYFIRQGFYRVGGVAEEPGHMAIFYNIYFSISLIYLHNKNLIHKYKWIVLLFIICQFALYSNAGMALALLAAIVIFSLKKLKNVIISKRQLFWISGVFILIILLFTTLFYFKSNHATFLLDAQNFINKIFFQEKGANTSSGARLHQWLRALSNFAKHPIFGNGPGYGVQQEHEGYLSLYLTILSDVGIFAFLLFMLFLLSLIKKVIKIKSVLSYFLLFGIITSFLHLFIIADFYSAPLWILFIFIQLVYKEEILKK